MEFSLQDVYYREFPLDQLACGKEEVSKMGRARSELRFKPK